MDSSLHTTNRASACTAQRAVPESFTCPLSIFSLFHPFRQPVHSGDASPRPTIQKHAFLHLPEQILSALSEFPAVQAVLPCPRGHSQRAAGDRIPCRKHRIRPSERPEKQSHQGHLSHGAQLVNSTDSLRTSSEYRFAHL